MSKLAVACTVLGVGLVLISRDHLAAGVIGVALALTPAVVRELGRPWWGDAGAAVSTATRRALLMALAIGGTILVARAHPRFELDTGVAAPPGEWHALLVMPLALWTLSWVALARPARVAASWIAGGWAAWLLLMGVMNQEAPGPLWMGLVYGLPLAAGLLGCRFPAAAAWLLVAQVSGLACFLSTVGILWTGGSVLLSVPSYGIEVALVTASCGGLMEAPWAAAWLLFRRAGADAPAPRDMQAQGGTLRFALTGAALVAAVSLGVVWFGGRPVYGTLGGPTREEIAHVNGLWERVIELAQVPDVSAAPDPDPLIALLEADDPHTDYPSVLLDIPDAGPVPAIEADRIPQEWRARGEALVAWHRAGAVTAMDARYDRPWHGLGIWRAHVALATEPGDGSHVAAVLALAHALRTRGLLIDGYVGTQMCLQAAQTATARGIPADAAWQRWRPHSGEVTGMLAREAVSAATLLGEYMSPGRFSGLARVFAEAERYEVRRVFASNVLAASHNTDPEAMALALADAATDARGYFASMMAQGDRSPLPRAIADAIAAFDAMPAR